MRLMITTTRIAIRCSFVLAAFATGLSKAAEADAWAIKDAPIRFLVSLTRAPSHPSAGFFVKLPDGGSLPGPFPEPVVLDTAGNILSSAVLWHCKETGCSLVFQCPKAGEAVTIYVRGGKKLKTWKPDSGLTPSVILCEVNGTSAKAAALKLGSLGSVDAKTLFVNKSWSCGIWQGHPIPLAMREWKPGGNAMYLLAHIDVTDPGPTWVAPQLRSGQMEIAVDGKMVPLSKKNEKLGGIGGEVNLTAGLHKLEIYGHSPEGKETGPMMFTWRTPKTTIEELGGPRAKDLRYPGTPMCESCIIDYERVVKSGDCSILDIQAQAGPVASFTLVPDTLFLFEGEETLIAYTLQAWTKGNPKETRYSWSFEQAPNALADGAVTHWLFNAERYGRVTLTAEAAGKRASTSEVVFFHTDQDSSLDNEETRYAFKRACFAMLKAYPDKVDPAATWDSAMWNNFFRVLEITGGNALIEYVVTQRWDFLKKKLTPERQALVEDIFLFSIGPRKPQEAMRWASKLSADEFSGGRSAVLKLKGAEILMYYLNDLDGARRIITPLMGDSGEAGERAKIRMGDLEFLAHNINAATQRYGDVQNRAKASAASTTPKRLTAIPSGATRTHKKTEEPVKEKGGDKTKKDAQKAVEPSKYVPMVQPSSLPAWKLSAIRDVAASENVNVLIAQGFYLEALQALQTWERVFPLSKISGDYILCEAKLYRAVKDFKRARLLLSAYCEQVDVSNFLPEAMELNRLCMVDMGESAEAIEKYKEEIRKRAFVGGAVEE